MAFKVLRLERYMELPGKAWAGWYFSRGQLVTPEGRTIDGSEGAWWSLLVRQAHGLGKLYRENLALKADLAPHGFAASEAQPPLRAAGAPVLASSGSGVPVTRHFSLVHETPTPKRALKWSLDPAAKRVVETFARSADLGVEVPVTPHLCSENRTSKSKLVLQWSLNPPQKLSAMGGFQRP